MDTYRRDLPKEIFSDFDNDSICSGSVSPSNRIRSGYYDDLDYNELLESGSDHDHFKRNRETEKSEEGEVTSDEEGEIKEDTFLSGKEDTFPSINEDTYSSGKEDTLSSGKEDTLLRGNEEPWRKEEHNEKTKRSSAPRVSTVPISSTTQKTKSRNICRHFLQGRCVWGDECRFSHDNSPEEDTPLFSRSRSPVDFSSGPPHLVYSRQPHLPPSIGPRGYIPPPHRFHGHPPSHHSVEVFPPQFSREPRSMVVMHPHYLSHLHPPNLPPHPYPSYPHWGPSSLGGGLLCGVEKVEEDQRWHRLRTITSGWDSEDDETDDRKLKKKMEASSSDIDSETEKKKKKKKKEKKKKKHKGDDEKGTEWVDSWSKRMKNRKDENDFSSEEEVEVRKKKKRERDFEYKRSSKTKQRETSLPSYSTRQSLSDSLTHREKILEELEHVNKALQRKKSSHHN